MGQGGMSLGAAVAAVRDGGTGAGRRKRATSSQTATPATTAPSRRRYRSELATPPWEEHAPWMPIDGEAQPSTHVVGKITERTT